MNLIDLLFLALQIFGFLLLFGGLLYHFAAIDVFNLLVPKDRGGKRVARRLHYGPDVRQRFDIYRPEQGNGPFPVVLFVHGGGWDSGRGEPYEFVARAFAAQGFLAATMTYRLAPKHVFPAFVEDVALATRRLQDAAARYGGDPEKIFLCGHSAGGYSLLQAVLDAQYLAAAGVDPTHVRAVAALAAPADFYPFDVKKSMAAFGSHPRPEETQPVNFARAQAPPLLLLHGTDDTTVYPHNSRNLHQAMQRAGGTSTLIEYAGTAHVGIMLALAKPFRKTPVLHDIMTFFTRYR